jgi:phage tail-like protein
MAATGNRVDPYTAFNFRIEIEGILAGAFSECTGLQVETEALTYREGGVNDYEHTFAGLTRFPRLVLKHGLTKSDGLWSWHHDVVGGKISRKNGTIYLLDAIGKQVVWWHFKEGLPIKWTGPEFRADSSGIAFESIELAHRGLSRSA